MVAWWQALMLSLVGGPSGGAIAVAGAWIQHGWTTKAAKRAEEREAIRRHRTERIKPIIECLDMCKNHIASLNAADTLQQVESDLPRDEAWRSAFKKWSEERKMSIAIDPTQFLRAVIGALGTASDERVTSTLSKLLHSIGDSSLEARARNLNSIRETEEALERYVVEV